MGLLSPKKFAIIGASNKKGKVGHVIFKNLKHMAYPVNPNHKTILGEKSYKSVVELRGKVSHAVICVPAKIVPQIIRECGQAEVKYAIVISAGFSESGNEKLNNELKKAIKESGVKVLGPNVLGIIKPGHYNASFYSNKLKSGSISFISQSGALGVGILDKLISEETGLRYFISVGNCIDITISDVLEELINDEKTKAVIIYIESLKKGKKFLEICKMAKKPIIVLKGGATKEGAKAAKTHTSSLAGDDRIYSSAFKQAGVKRVYDISTLINSALLLEKGFKGKALIITNAGGPGILMTDALASRGIELAELPKRVIKKLDQILPKSWSKNNPIDIIGDADAKRYGAVLNAIEKEKFYDYVIVILTPQAMTQPYLTAQKIMKFKRPVIPCFIGGDSIKKAVNYMKKKLIVFNDIASLAEALRK